MDDLRTQQPFHRHMNRLLTVILMALIMVGCTPPKKQKGLEQRLDQYESMIRWSQWDAAATYLDPEYLEENPVTNLDMERLRLFRVTNYTVRSASPVGDGSEYAQVVELRMFNRNQATERVIMDSQLWRWDEEMEQWLLKSGLPDVTQRY